MLPSFNTGTASVPETLPRPRSSGTHSPANTGPAPCPSAQRGAGRTRQLLLHKVCGGCMLEVGLGGQEAMGQGQAAAGSARKHGRASPIGPWGPRCVSAIAGLLWPGSLHSSTQPENSGTPLPVLHAHWAASCCPAGGRLDPMPNRAWGRPVLTVKGRKVMVIMQAWEAGGMEGDGRQVTLACR